MELGRGPSSLASLGSVGQTHGNDLAVELNEAFAAQVIPIMDECDIPLGKLNAHGGAIALGHPFGMTGARIMATLLNAMETTTRSASRRCASPAARAKR